MPFLIIYAMCSCIGLVMDAMFWHSVNVAHVIPLHLIGLCCDETYHV
jgi:hypothetical protein